MIQINSDEIIHIHKIIEDKFGITQGIIHRGNIDAIVQRPNTQIGEDYVFDTVFKKAACLLEAIIRWHPFADGNKRTALLSTVYYLKLQGYGIVIPLSAVRYTVRIAKNQKTEQEDIEKLINEIADWLKNHSGKSQKELQSKIRIYVDIPYRILIILDKIGFEKYVTRKIKEWLVFDTYPEYEKEVTKVIDFIHNILNENINMFDESKQHLERK